MRILITFTIVTVALLSFAQEAIDYKVLGNWAAHPSKQDASDLAGQKTDSLPYDVFFVYPTLYAQDDFTSYSADIKNEELNLKIQESTIANQASVFSGHANVYSPYYRQMHIKGYYVKDSATKKEAMKAFNLAYSDVLQAFLHYIKFENNGRPFVLASHSQGTNHCERLLKEVILPTQILKNKLIIAYLVGMPIKNQFQTFEPCEKPSDIGCYVTWRTYNKKFTPKEKGDSIVCTNPVTFSSAKLVNEKIEHSGILNPKKNKITAKNGIVAEAKDGYLGIEIKKWPLKWFYNWDNYHVADYNMFWPNIRANFVERLEAFEKVN